jgi:hypothetical protein
VVRRGLKGTSNVIEPAETKLELRFKSSILSISQTFTLLITKEYRNMTKTLEGSGSHETFKSKDRLFQEDASKQLLAFQHAVWRIVYFMF